MLREHATMFRRLMIFADLCIVTGAFFLAYYLRDAALCPISGLLWFLLLFVALWGFLLYFSGMYASFRLKNLKEVLFIIYQASYLGFFIFAALCYVFKVPSISRIFVFSSFILAMFFLAVEKVALIQFFRHLRRKNFNYKNILIVGTGERARDFIQKIEQNREFGLHIIGLINTEDTSEVGNMINGYKVLGTLKDIPEIFRNNILDQVLFIVPYSSLGKIEESMLYLQTVGVRVDIAMDYFSRKLAWPTHTEFFGVPFLSFASTQEKLLPLLIKRFFDMAVSCLGLVLLAPVFVITALLIKITSPVPIFFTQERGSLNGRRFKLYKFRTMAADAEFRLNELRELNEMEGPVFKVKNDPRITPLGRWLRKFSIDELPQIWNVLKGDMSLVGPRPPLMSEVSQYDDWQMRRLSMRPGITCLWQVKGRNKITDFSQWVKLDLEYIDNWSLWLDLRILLKTIPVVFFGIGAK